MGFPLDRPIGIGWGGRGTLRITSRGELKVGQGRRAVSSAMDDGGGEDVAGGTRWAGVGGSGCDVRISLTCELDLTLARVGESGSS